MNTRTQLKESITLWGESDGGRFRRTFAIGSTIRAGASSICYEASHEGSGPGVLKEFWPRWAGGLERDAGGQLVCAGGREEERSAFRAAQEEYLQPYRLLLRLKRENAEGELAAFLPAFELYWGEESPEGGVGAAYLWTPEPRLETFDHICREIRRAPGRKPEHKLVLALSAVRSLTQCVRVLHAAGLIHRDINPSNFGFVKRGEETLTETISLFDINTICSVYQVPDETAGTPGYLEPEAGYQRASNQTDLYAIGATLLRALAVEEEDCLAGGDVLSRMVDTSPLIRASEANSHPRLRSALTRVLRRCLCRRGERYRSCEELLDDLDAALYYALPSELARKGGGGQRWVLADVERALDARTVRHSTLALQRQLYRRPLFRCCGQEGRIPVLVVGFGRYGQSFLDLCLQVGQMPGRKLDVLVVSGDPTDRDIYLAERPALSEFFDVDGSLNGREDAYGRLRFRTAAFSEADQARNAALLEELLCSYEDEGPCYLFVALGEDGLNRSAVAACRTAASVLERDCCVSFAWEGDPAGCPREDGLEPVFMGRAERNGLDDELERMAFNVHLVWEKDRDVDRRTVRARFQRKYNHDSCVSNVLSIKYKLYSVGIDLEALGPDEAAARFAAAWPVSGQEELVCAEHRRWVTEKLCAGWRRLEPLEDCLTMGTRDEKGRRHVCLVRSRPDRGLAEKFGGARFSKWDEAAEAELAELDELDRVSVELHRLYAARARQVRERELFPEERLAELRDCLEGHTGAVVALQEWAACAREIWNGGRDKAALYRGRRDVLCRAVRALPAADVTAVEERLRALDALFAPVVAAVEYRDYKQDDVDLVRFIPFLLTYAENTTLAVPLALGDNTAVFSNVAAASVVDPERLLLLDWADGIPEQARWRQTLSYLSAYLEKKRLRARVELLVLRTDAEAGPLPAGLEEELRRCTGGRVERVKELCAEDPDRLARVLSRELRLRCRGKRLLAVEENETRLCYFLRGAGFYREFASYRFALEKRAFTRTEGCRMFSYIPRMPHIQVSDLAAFRRAGGGRSRQPEFFADYQELWNEYREKGAAWKRLCDLLRDHARQHDILAVFARPRVRPARVARYRYLLPAACGAGARKVVEALVRAGAAGEESRVSGFTTDACQVVILDRWGDRKPYEQMFARPYALMDGEGLEPYQDVRSNKVVVRFDDLRVCGFRVEPGRGEELLELLRYFAVKGYIAGLIIREESVDFTYATRAIKGLLTTAGRILEIYTYHKARELDQFSDVASSLELEWEGAAVANEFDCVLTMGFSTLFVECKARAELEQDFYYKLAELTRHFGINARAVLVADTRERGPFGCALLNGAQRRRGGQMDVITIWDRSEIDDIGNTLLKVLRGTYTPKEWEEAHV